MILRDLPMASLAEYQSFVHARGLVAKVLLEYAGEITTGQHQLAQRDIAVLADTDWGTVHMSLRSLQDEGAISIERHRIIINKEMLQKMMKHATTV
jgi:DNA-binding MarR family transcriptional regulator